MEKAELRRTLRRARRAVDPVTARQAAEHCAGQLSRCAVWRSASHVGLYLPADGEMDTTPLYALDGERTHYLPCIDGDSLRFAPWQPGQTLVENRFGIGEPGSASQPASSLDLLLLPLVGFSRAGVRLGMGGGFYDRCLGALPAGKRPWMLGYAYELQRLQDLEPEPWDVLLDAVITERGCSPCSARARKVIRQ